MSSNFKDWQKDFDEFMQAPSVAPARLLADKVANIVSQDLQPSSWSVFSKLLIITALSGLASLAVCPQFGFGKSIWIMDFFMQFGPTVCSLSCGAIFISLGVAIAGASMRPEELRVLRENRILQLSTLPMLSLAAFICAGGEVLLSVAVLWTIGGMLGGFVATEVAYRLKVVPVTLR